MMVPTLLDVAALGETVPGLAVVLPATFELHHGGGAAVAVDDAAIPGQGLGQPLGLALNAHLRGRRVNRLVRVVAVAGDSASVNHLGRYHVDDGVVDFGHGKRKKQIGRRVPVNGGERRTRAGYLCDTVCRRFFERPARVVVAIMACIVNGKG